MLIAVRIHDFLIQRIRGKPVDGGKVAGKGQFIIQAPNFTTRSVPTTGSEKSPPGRYRADNGKAPRRSSALANNAAATFIETGNAGTEVRRIAFFPGHFLKAS